MKKFRVVICAMALLCAMLVDTDEGTRRGIAIDSDAEQEAAARKGSRPSVPDSGIPLISDPETKAMLQALMAAPLWRYFAEHPE